MAVCPRPGRIIRVWAAFSAPAAAVPAPAGKGPRVLFWEPPRKTPCHTLIQTPCPPRALDECVTHFRGRQITACRHEEASVSFSAFLRRAGHIILPCSTQRVAAHGAYHSLSIQVPRAFPRHFTRYYKPLSPGMQPGAYKGLHSAQKKRRSAPGQAGALLRGVISPC